MIRFGRYEPLGCAFLSSNATLSPTLVLALCFYFQEVWNLIPLICWLSTIGLVAIQAGFWCFTGCNCFAYCFLCWLVRFSSASVMENCTVFHTSFPVLLFLVLCYCWYLASMFFGFIIVW